MFSVNSAMLVGLRSDNRNITIEVSPLIVSDAYLPMNLIYQVPGNVFGSGYFLQNSFVIAAISS
jgi:hypothetical protein